MTCMQKSVWGIAVDTADTKKYLEFEIRAPSYRTPRLISAVLAWSAEASCGNSVASPCNAASQPGLCNMRTCDICEACNAKNLQGV